VEKEAGPFPAYDEQRRQLAMASYVGSKVRTRRLRQGWTQHQLASYAGITTEQVSRIERDLVQPRWKTIIRLADALDIDNPFELLDDD
jgi:transcriptional regulator with XRE-family HTH domain